ncbi:hypothetical protein ABPG72_013295 [Tetrahymena utriculariae]
MIYQLAIHSSLQTSPKRSQYQRPPLKQRFLPQKKDTNSFQDSMLDLMQQQQEIKNNFRNPSPQIRQKRNYSSHVEQQSSQIKEDDQNTQNCYVGFEERKKLREKQIIGSYFKNKNSDCGSTMLSIFDNNERSKSINKSTNFIRDTSPIQESNKSMLKLENLDTQIYNKNELQQLVKKNQSGVQLGNIFQNTQQIKLAPLFVQQQKKLRFESDEIERLNSEVNSNFLNKSLVNSRVVSPLNRLYQQSFTKQQKIVQNNSLNQTKQQFNNVKKPAQSDKINLLSQQQSQGTQSSLQYQTTTYTQPSQQYIQIFQEDMSMEYCPSDINPQLYVSFCKEHALPVIDEADNNIEQDPHQIKFKTLNSQDFRQGNGQEVLSMEESTTAIQTNLTPFPINYTKKKCLRKSGFTKIFLCERKLDDIQFICKEFDFSKNEKAKELYLNEIEFYSCFMRNSQVRDYFQKYPGFKYIPYMDYNEVLINYMTDVEYGFLITEFIQKPLRKSIFDVKKETVAGEEMYQINLKPLYNHLVEEPDNFKRFIKDIAEYLSFLQQTKWSHGDLRLDNIVVNSTQIAGSEFLDYFKVIDYCSSFRTNKFKGLQSHITPEYMPPEFLKHLIADKFETEQLQQDAQYDIFQYAVDPEAPSSLDIWSLGCLILELVLAVPLWVTQRCRVKQKNLIMRGLFSTKERKIEQIYTKQKKFLKQYLQIMKSLKMSNLDKQIKLILDGCLKINPRDRITPEQILEILSKRDQKS